MDTIRELAPDPREAPAPPMRAIHAWGWPLLFDAGPGRADYCDSLITERLRQRAEAVRPDGRCAFCLDAAGAIRVRLRGRPIYHRVCHECALRPGSSSDGEIAELGLVAIVRPRARSGAGLPCRGPGAQPAIAPAAY